MDHKGRDEVDTLKYVANIFNNYPINQLTICEPHSSITEFQNAKKFSLIKNIKDKVFKELTFNENDFTVVLTDKGSYKRYKDIFINKVYFEKVRDKNTGLIKKHNIVGAIRNCNKVLIVDDIISTGDTIINIVEISFILPSRLWIGLSFDAKSSNLIICVISTITIHQFNIKNY